MLPLLFFKDSKILKTDEYFQQLSEWFYSEGHTWKLCYRASTHGWYAKDFHARCDDQGPTVVLVKVHDYIFGGFTDSTWRGPGTVCLVLKKENFMKITIALAIG